MMERFQFRRSEHHVTFCAFDILYYDQDSVMYLPLIERKELLKRILPQHPHAAYVQHIVGRGLDYFALVKEKGLEGIVLKKSKSLYNADARSKNWLKVINYQYEPVYFTEIQKMNLVYFYPLKTDRPPD